MPFKPSKGKFRSVELARQFCNVVHNVHAKDVCKVDHARKIFGSNDTVRLCPFSMPSTSLKYTQFGCRIKISETFRPKIVPRIFCYKRCCRDCRDSYPRHALRVGAKCSRHLRRLIVSYDMHGAIGCIPTIDADENGRSHLLYGEIDCVFRFCFEVGLTIQTMHPWDHGHQSPLRHLRFLRRILSLLTRFAALPPRVTFHPFVWMSDG